MPASSLMVTLSFLGKTENEYAILVNNNGQWRADVLEEEPVHQLSNH
jgi:hypothetical protein